MLLPVSEVCAHNFQYPITTTVINKTNACHARGAASQSNQDLVLFQLKQDLVLGLFLGRVFRCWIHSPQARLNLIRIIRCTNALHGDARICRRPAEHVSEIT